MLGPALKETPCILETGNTQVENRSNYKFLPADSNDCAYKYGGQRHTGCASNDGKRGETSEKLTVSE